MTLCERSRNNSEPAFISPTGLPIFYLDRCINYLKRQSTFPINSIPSWHEIDMMTKTADYEKGPIQYYLDCIQICARFAKYSSLLSQSGKDWSKQVSVALQQEIADRVKNDPFGFAKNENDHGRFSHDICQDHYKVYTKYFNRLSLPDLVKIPIIPFVKFFLDPNNFLTAMQVGLNTLPRITNCLHNHKDPPTNPIDTQPIKPSELHDYLTSPFYFHARIAQCIENENLNFPYYYELTASISSGFIKAFPQLSEVGKCWVINTQRALVNNIEMGIRRDSEKFSQFERSSEFDKEMLLKHHKIYENSGFNSLSWSDIALISKTIITSIPPETVAAMGKTAFTEVQTLLNLLSKRLCTA